MSQFYSSSCLSFLLMVLVAACGSNDPNTSPSDDAAGDISDSSGDVEAELPDSADIADNDVADDTSQGDETNTDVDTSDAIDDGAVDTADANNTDAADDVVADVDTDAGDDVDVDVDDTTPDTAPDSAPDSSCEYPACEYLDLDIWLVRCGETWKYGRLFSDVCNRSECAAGNWVVLDGTRYDTVEDAYAATSCDPQCELRAATSVSFVYCERRNGYIVYESTEPACPALYEFSDGLYSSYEDWVEANPCE